jgi:hypothetical protein
VPVDDEEEFDDDEMDVESTESPASKKRRLREEYLTGETADLLASFKHDAEYVHCFVQHSFKMVIKSKNSFCFPMHFGS